MTVNSKSEKNKNVLQLNIDTIEEILDMSVMGEVQMNLPLPNTDSVGQNELCKSDTHIGLIDKLLSKDVQMDTNKHFKRFGELNSKLLGDCF